MSTTSDDFIRFDFLMTDAYQYDYDDDDDDLKIIYEFVARSKRFEFYNIMYPIARTVAQHFCLFCFQKICVGTVQSYSKHCSL